MAIDPAILRRGRTGFTPVVFCSVYGNNITDLLRPRLIEATVDDGAGFESDGLTIVVDNAGDVIARPRKKAVVVFGGGFKETGGAIRLGTYEVEDAEKTFLRRTMTIIARAAKIGDSMKVRKHRAFENVTVGDIVMQIADRLRSRPAASHQQQDRQHQGAVPGTARRERCKPAVLAGSALQRRRVSQGWPAGVRSQG